MKKNGFTIIELIAVVAIIMIIVTIGMYSVIGLRKAIKEMMWNNKVVLIEKMAVKFGEDHENKFDNSTCGSGTKIINNCFEITVQTLINRKYITTRNIRQDEEGNDYRALINDVSDEVINDKDIYIYKENNFIYAKLQCE